MSSSLRNCTSVHLRHLARRHGVSGLAVLLLAMLLVFGVSASLANSQDEAVGAAETGQALQQAFWQAPGYETLIAYAEYLEETTLSEEERQRPAFDPPWNEALERMKRLLAEGIFGPPATPYPEWDKLKQAAATWERERRQMQAATLRKYATDPAEELRMAASRYDNVRKAIDVFELDDIQALALVNAIDLPPVQQSLFDGMAALAPASDSAERVGGRFRIPYAVRFQAPDHPHIAGKPVVSGVWGMTRASALLTRPVRRNVLFRDGTVAASTTHLKRSFVVPGEPEEIVCAGSRNELPSVSSLPAATAATADPDQRVAYAQGEEKLGQTYVRTARNSPVQFFTPISLPRQRAQMTVARHLLDGEQTGFLTATITQFDLDGDGIPDIAVWEGISGDGEAADWMKNEVSWRLLFANLAGRWHLFARDSFGYECGC